MREGLVSKHNFDFYFRLHSSSYVVSKKDYSDCKNISRRRRTDGMKKELNNNDDGDTKQKKMKSSLSSSSSSSSLSTGGRRLCESSDAWRSLSSSLSSSSSSQLLLLQSRDRIIVFPCWMDRLPSSLRVHIYNYLDQDSIMSASCVSKQWHQECNSDNLGLETKVVPILQLSPKQPPKEYADVHDDIEDYYYYYFYGSTRRLLRYFQRYQKDQERMERYRRLVLQDVHKFDKIFFNVDDTANRVQLPWIIELDMSWISSVTQTTTQVMKYHTTTNLPYYLSRILPNLKTLNLSKTGLSYDVLRSFTNQCPLLERIIWTNICHHKSHVDLDGTDFQASKSTLKDLCLDNSILCGPIHDYQKMCSSSSSSSTLTKTTTSSTTISSSSDNSNNNNNDDNNEEEEDGEIILFLLYKCCGSYRSNRTTNANNIDDTNNDDEKKNQKHSVLERLSLRNVKYVSSNGTAKCIDQAALLKFVRCAPKTLRYFCSDLSTENMVVLRKERPGITLVN